MTNLHVMAENPRDRAEALVANVERLIALPEAWVQISREIDEGGDAFRIARAIEMDTDLSARLLRIVNSSVYRLAAPVETISRAVTFVGTTDLRDLATLTVARRLFTGIPADLMDTRSFWTSSLQTGVYASLLGVHCRILHPERVFVMGVLHNVGLLLECQYLPEKTREALYIANDDHDLLTAAEEEVLGFSHQDVGGALLRRWGLPESICQVAEYHHRPSAAESHALEVAIVHVAAILSDGEKQGLDSDTTWSRISPDSVELLSLDTEGLEALREEGKAQVDELTNVFMMPGTAGGRPRR